MAKDLPYFKFFCSEWSDGDITLESYELQGLFVNICAYYWSNECVLELTKLKKRFRDCITSIDSLIDNNLIKLDDGFVSINFLNEQKIEREEQSKNKSKGGIASAEARKNAKIQQEVNTPSTESQHLLNSCSTESQLLREDKIREDKIRISSSAITKALLSEIKISDDKKFFLFGNSEVEIKKDELSCFEIANSFRLLFIKNLSEKSSPTTTQEKATFGNYVTQIRLMLENKECSMEQIREAYRYLDSKEGEFWKSNILSTKKLREQISQIILRKNTQAKTKTFSKPIQRN